MKMDLEALQVELSDKRFEENPFPTVRHGVREMSDIVTKKRRTCSKCGAKIAKTNESGLCKKCFYSPCVYRCGNKVGPQNRICESCKQKMQREDSDLILPPKRTT